MSDKALHAICSALLSNGWTDPAHCDYVPTAEAILSALSAARIAVVEMPPVEPTRTRGCSTVHTDDDFELAINEDGGIMRNGYGWTDCATLDASEARAMAAALLAAADAVEVAL